MNPVKVLLVDDSAVVRQIVGGVLQADPRVELVGVAADPVLAMNHMRREWPEVILLDIEMPKMDGLTFLRKIMAERPTAVIICSTLTEAGARVNVDALSAGAVATIQKPKLGLKSFLTVAANDIVQAVLMAARANLRQLTALPLPPPKLGVDAMIPTGAACRVPPTAGVVAIGASTGGTQALEVVLSALPQNAPSIVVVQHMPEKFTLAFAERLDSVCRVRVVEARHGMAVVPGQVLIAPGGRHMLLRRQSEHYSVDVIDGPLISRHRPSVDVLFRSVAKCAGANACGIILTGMGDDGAAGLADMRAAGARTLAQDEASCVVYGMPKEAVKRGAVEQSIPLHAVAAAIMRM